MPHRIKHNQKGFTIQELLITITITVILLAVSIMGVVTYMRHLQITELDNAAREIFLAAQNRAILLSASQRLEKPVIHPNGDNRIEHVDLIPGGGQTTQITVYYIHLDDENIDKLLPEDTIDPALWGGDFYITYEPESGSVVDVFYSDHELPVEGNFPAFYETWRGASKSSRMHSRPMIGYYGGESAQSGSTISLRTPVINIQNDNKLRAQVTYWVPRSLAAIGEERNIHLTVGLHYQGKEVLLRPEDAISKREPGMVYIAYTYTWTLDSLCPMDPADPLDDVHFKDFFAKLGGKFTYGEDFTIDAQLSYTGSLTVNGSGKTATDNSLFAKGSQGETAYIACLRHLQNLDVGFSGVSGKSKAVQKRDIPSVKGYVFQPIRNQQLWSYDGAKFSITDLNIKSFGQEASGLFGVLNGTQNAPKKLDRIRLVGTSSAAESGLAGALIGTGSYVDVTDCQVYWENRSNQSTNLREQLGDSKNGFKYKINGPRAAGGLAGGLEHARIEDSLAATLVSSSGTAGGLVGQGGSLTIAGSYAATYLQAPAAAGLVGELTQNSSTSVSYAVGFIDSGTDADARAAGLALGAGAMDVTRSYSAMLFTAGDHVNNYPLCQKGSYDHTYYLSSELFDFGQEHKELAKSYSELTDPAKWDDMFGQGTFALKGAAQSHPYNLQTTLSLTSYIYPGSKTLDHWGDWGAQFQNGSLVYYERYTDDTYGFDGGDTSHLQNKLVKEDGYAVAYRSTDSISGVGAVLNVTYQTGQGEQTERFAYGSGEDGKIYEVHDVTDSSGEVSDYYLFVLPSQVVNTDYTSENFYQKISITNVDEGREKCFYYNPHFANPVLPCEDGMDLAQQASQLRVVVRSPRHLYMLSRFASYYTSRHQYRFVQQLDLDYDVYTGYDLFTGDWSQKPIGIDAARPMRGSYYGNSHTIAGVRNATTDENGRPYQYMGLFGYSTSVLRDIAYLMERSPVMTISYSGGGYNALYIGGLVGYNGGNVDNCAISGVRMQISCYDYSTIFTGGLAGRNEGTIYSSSAEVINATVDASLSHAYTGGFVGRNTEGGMIDQCYAVGSVSTSRARHGTVYASGFAGRNEATLRRSYAAVSLWAEGGSRSYGFCPEKTTDCVYLNEGNFTYREKNYAAQYEDPSAAPVIWEQLTGQEESTAVQALRMEWNTGSFHTQQTYPYPGAVMDAEDRPIHYGLWPDRMDLGTMGVYYWEKMTIGSVDSYHFSVISAINGEPVRSDTLSNAHGDGGVVTEYGYGYFHMTGTEKPSIGSRGVYWDDQLFDPEGVATNQSTNDALSDLMSGKYVFYSYDTWKADRGAGLHLIGDSGNQGSIQPPVGVWTLRQSGEELTVRLNPLFANSMAHENESLPGTEDNQYEVRSIEQLRFINWNSTEKNTDTVLHKDNAVQFPFLSYGIDMQLTQRSYYWEQTHDLDGKKRVYTPIAEFYDPDWGVNGGTLSGWFGGTYDGNDYVIADVNIHGQTSSCVGLFGAVFDGTLKNIVMHSTDGTGTVEGSDSGTSQWYAIGGLAGLTGSTKGSAVTNCAVTGYTVQDTHQATKKGGWGGTGLGGLIGVCDMSLENCTAVTHIKLDSRDNDNVRLGGLVGSCQGSISSCYAGGSITVASTSSVFPHRGIYGGGIVGGIYMKPLKVGNRSDITVGRPGQQLQNTLNNCYSYVILPNASSNRYIRGLYAVGGSGELNRDKEHDDPDHINSDHGWSNYNNNFYLALEALQNNQGGITGIKTDLDQEQVVGMTYSQMADSTDPNGLLQRLNAAGGGFGTVTTETVNGDPISGRFSFGISDSLLGKNYPFPTILTQSSSVAPEGRANVHYGDWPLAGIRREYGALPVNVDLFADYSEKDHATMWTESLTLAGVPAGGAWSVSSDQPEIVSAVLEGGTDNEKTLCITALAQGRAIVTAVYEVEGNTYTLPIEVNVTAQLRVAAKTPSSILAFTGESVSVPLELRDKNGKPIPDVLKNEITLNRFGVEFDPAYFADAQIQMEQELLLRADSLMAPGTTQMTAVYDFAYLGTDYHLTSVLTLRVEQPEILLRQLEFVFKDSTQKQQDVLYTGADGFELTINGEPVAVTGLQIIDFKEVAAEFKDVVLAQWAKNDDGTDQVGTLSITAYPPKKLDLANALVELQFRFQCEGVTHTMWQSLPIQVRKEQEPTPPEPPLPPEPPQPPEPSVPPQPPLPPETPDPPVTPDPTVTPDPAEPNPPQTQEGQS